MKKYLRLGIILWLVACSVMAFSQSVSFTRTLSASLDTLRKRLPVEKLYVQTDKPGYMRGDTLWFKAYLLDAAYLGPSRQSGLVYLELDDVSGKSVKRVLVPVSLGLGWGSIVLDEKDVPEGNYTLRAYTTWMRNFGNDRVFVKQIRVAAVDKTSRLVSTGFKTEAASDGSRSVQAQVALRTLTNAPLLLTELQVKVNDGKRTYFNEKLSTGVDGLLNFKFELPAEANTANLKILTTDIGKDYEARQASILPIPVILPIIENTDLQFMPEGGTLVAGIMSKVAFKAINENGHGTDIAGRIVNSKKEVVVKFSSVHKGMGSFELLPKSGETYTAEVALPQGGVKSFVLPAVTAVGTTLKLEDKTDSIKVTITGTTAGTYYLSGQSRGVLCYTARVTLSGNSIMRCVPKSAFPSGVARFTLLNETNLPLNERIVFIDHNDNLKIAITSDKQSYLPGDSIALKIKVADKDGKPVQGSFSLAVTDDNQVGNDSLSNTIESHMLLTADLKGNIEEPGYYFMDSNQQKKTELDNLLLTQGWVGYDWKNVFNGSPKPEFERELGYSVQGKVTNVFNRPVSKAPITLLSKSPSMFLTTITGADGKFKFDGFVPLDTASFMIQARNKNNKSFNVGIEMETFKAPIFPPTQTVVPWYVNTDAVFINAIRNATLKEENEIALSGGGRLLKAVTITEKRKIKGSKTLNEPDEIDQVFNDDDTRKAGNITLLEFLKKNVKGINYINERALKINDSPILLVVDGILSRGAYNYIAIEDLRGIEIIYNYPKKYIVHYLPGYQPPRRMKSGPVFIEVTTRSGRGIETAIPGTILYRPIEVGSYKQFYRPRYTIKTPALKFDTRSTIHWEPNITSDEAGNALVTFYSVGNPAAYSVKIEGTDLDGQIGVGVKKVNVVAAP